ncbi:glycosyltransferase [Leeuwenhoekiella marinoflava]|uniref:glycosyltransferase n=1 Tax=Leeuwenhoekiella marinoflava TaxID=988 RepID=UPI0030034741
MKTIVVCVPYLQKAAGTELEALITAIQFASMDDVDNVKIFSPDKANEELKSKTENFNIQFLNYPNFYKNSYVNKLNRFLKPLFKFMNKDFDPIYYLYWVYFRLRYNPSIGYILTPTYSNYFFSIVFGLNFRNVTLKYTAFDLWFKPSEFLLNIYKKCASIIVTGEVQKNLLLEFNSSLNAYVLDVFLWTEDEFLNLPINNRKQPIHFGMLCRISPEKNILDGIKLVEFLTQRGIQACLKIQGILYSKEYLKELHNEIRKRNLNSYISISILPIDRFQVNNFYDSIDCFLITSKSEGGPTTGLEAMACAKMILSYDIAAMAERLKPFGNRLIARNFEELCGKAQILINLSDWKPIGLNLRLRYIEKYSNDLKLKQLMKILQI